MTAASTTSTSASTAGRVRSNSAVLEEDRARERVEAHQRHDAEVGQRVERDQQRAGRQRRAQAGSVTRPEHLRGGAPSDRAASSSERSLRRSAAPQSRNTYG